ncbi:MAG: c-type cytochrome [Bacteroidia bacterium]|nr:c-type cytochrome [Bacteroidia bacterium]
MALRLLLICCMAAALSACTSKEQAARDAKNAPSPAEVAVPQPEVHGKPVSTVKLTNPLDAEWVSTGKSIYETKCLACHRLTTDRLVGPGWAGVTQRRTPEWIMNMITNVEMMLATDEEAQKQLELCLVRMPNQNVSEADARKILEFMRQNDGEK